MKKHALIILIYLISNFVVGQDTIYLDDDYKEIKSFKNATYFKIIEKYENNQILQRTYQKNGQIKFETEFKITENDKKIYNGNHKAWYDSGELRFVAFYENGSKNGEFLSYWENGKLKRKDYYKNGKFKNGECWNEDGEKIKHYDYEIHPKYPGGKDKMYEFIQKNLKYPPLSLNYNISGKVIVNFIIDKEGNVSEVKVLEAFNSELDAEAIRIIKSMPKWEPGFQDGIAVPVKYSIPIVFNP